MKRTIDVEGVGRATVVPDRASVRIGIEATRPTAAAATSDGGAAAERVLAALQRLGLAAADIATVELDLAPVYEPSADVPRLVGHRMRQVLLVRVRDLAAVGPAIDAAVEAGATRVEGMAFETSDASEAEDAARIGAVRDVARRADALAAEAGAKRGRLIRVSEVAAGPVPFESLGMVRAMAATPVQPGTREIVMRVKATYRLRRR